MDWGQLVCITDISCTPFKLSKDITTIGRAQKCDIVHESNLVSGTHCYILRDDGGKAWIYDSSTNGTLVNFNNKLSKGECRELSHGDEFYLMFKKSDDSANIGYVFQDLLRLSQEEHSDVLDSTVGSGCSSHLNSTVVDVSVNESLDDDSLPVPMKHKESGDQSSSSVGTAATIVATKSDDNGTAHSLSIDHDTAAGGTVGKVVKERVKDSHSDLCPSNAFHDTLTCIICREILHDCISLQPCMHCFCSGCYSSWMECSKLCPSCRSHVDRISKNHTVTNLVEAYLQMHPEKRRTPEDIKRLDAVNKITRDMLYSKRKHESNDSSADSDIDHDDNNSSDEDFGVNFPSRLYSSGSSDRRRDNVSNRASCGRRRRCRQCLSGNNRIEGLSGNNRMEGPSGNNGMQDPSANDGMHGPSGNNHIQRARNNLHGEMIDGDEYLERDHKVMPDLMPAFTCSQSQNHLLCQCCRQPFPDRRRQGIARGGNPTDHNIVAVPAQQCAICCGNYCHCYWGCDRPDCNGCLALFNDMTFGQKVLPGLILENQYESSVLMSYMRSRKLAVIDVLRECIAKMEQGQYRCPDQARFQLDGQTPICFTCGLRNFKVLAFQFRADLPSDQLPADVTARPSCYWGKNCHTQRNKPSHARRFNHICEQIRF